MLARRGLFGPLDKGSLESDIWCLGKDLVLLSEPGRGSAAALVGVSEAMLYAIATVDTVRTVVNV